MEIVEVTPAAVALQQAYVTAGIVSAKWATDALHVALATASRCDAIVSWNFRHIVHLNKIALYNQVNAARGHSPIAIVSPPEVIAYDEP